MLEVPERLLTARATVLEGPERLLTTGTTMLEGPNRLLTTEAIALEDKSNSPGGASEAVNNNDNSAGGTREAVNNRSNSAGGARETVNNRSNSAGGTREVVYNMRISAGGAREVFFVSLYDGKPKEALDALLHMRFCEQVRCQTVHGQPQDWKVCASRLVPEEWGFKIKEGKMLPIQTFLSPAPIKLMDMIKCNCGAGCSSGRCTCKKHGLQCSCACGECKV